MNGYFLFGVVTAQGGTAATVSLRNLMITLVLQLHPPLQASSSFLQLLPF